jgi:peptidoglycan/xylan/chitin deacetylase (PgdA/CDA1 family)
VWFLGPRIRLPILYYHEIGLERSKHVVHPDDFEVQMRWLRDTSHEFLRLDDVVELYAGRRTPPERCVVLTFDDGRAGVLRHAAPILARYELRAMLYVVTDWLDGQRPSADHEHYSEFLGWEDLAEVQQAGIEIGSHTLSHRNLKRLPEEEAEHEIRASRRILEDRLGQPVPHFSFPKGRATRFAERCTRDTGYQTAVATGQRWNRRRASLHHLHRLRVDGTGALEDFQQILARP